MKTVKKIVRVILYIFSLLCILLTLLFGKILYDLGFFECKHTSFSQVEIAATCTKEGRSLKRCGRCGYEQMINTIKPLGHALSSIDSPATCSSQGYTLHYCSCGYSFTSDFTPPTEHELECNIISPTCDEQGYHNCTCKLCDYSFKSDFTEPTGHSFTSECVLPTATRAGYTKYTCDCSYSYIGDHVYYSDILESAYTQNTTVLSRGLDVSRWNHQIDTASGEYLPLDWQLIRSSGFDYVILKAGSTKSGIEPTFEIDYEGAKSAGLEVGAYFYTYSLTVEGIRKDAQMLLLWLEGKQFEYPVYLDLEDPSLQSLGKNHLSNMCVAFLETLQENGYYAGLYTNHTWLTTILDTPRIVSLFDIWYARYPGTSVPAWNEEKYGKQLGMWQYTQSGTISGIEGYFDLNYSYKGYREIMQKWGLNGY